MQTEASWLSNVDLCKALEHLESNAIVQRELNNLFQETEACSEFDDSEFSVVHYINRVCPDDCDLETIDAELKNLKSRIDTTNGKLHQALHSQNEALKCIEQDFCVLQQAGEDVMQDLQSIAQQSTEAEDHIEAVWNDVTALHRGRHNLSTTITSLKQLTMLVTALDELRCICAERRYAEAAHLVAASIQLATPFENHTSSPRIRDLLREHQTFLHDLRLQLLDDFDALYETADATTQEPLKDACRVVDAISSTFRKEILDRFADKYFEVYHAAFPSSAALNQPLAALETLERRFLWFRQQFREFSKRYGTFFLESWGVLQFISVRFCRLVRTQLIDILGVAHVDPNLLIRTLQKTKEFERFLEDHFSDASRVGTAAHISELLISLEEQDRVAKNSTIRLLQYPELLHTKATDNASANCPTAAQPSSSVVFHGSISACFDAFMMPWVRNEEKRLQSILCSAVKDDKMLFDQAISSSEEGGWSNDTQTLFSSAIDILAAIKASFQRCSAISTGQPLLDIVAVFQRILTAYVNALTAQCVSSKVTEVEKKEDLYVAVLGTVEYVEATLPHLTQALASVIENTAPVTFADQEEALLNLKSLALAKLLGLLYPRVEVHLQKLSETNWAAMLTVEDEGPWVRDLTVALTEFFTSVGKKLSTMLFRLLCGTFFQWFIKAYRVAVYNSQQLAELGAQQLLLDTHAVKTAVHDLPALLPNGPSPIYSKVVLREFGSLEVLLKILSSAASTPQETLVTLLTEDAGITDPAVLEATLKLRSGHICTKTTQHRSVVLP